MSTSNQTPQGEQPAAAVAKTKAFEEGTVEAILKRVNEFQSTGDLVLPTSYIAENAVRAAWLVLQQTVDKNNAPALSVCSKESIANAFLEMVTKGLSVVKNQGYFIVYGTKLEFEESYIGTIAIAKRDADVKEVNAVTVYEGDEFDYEINEDTGRKKVLKHVQKLQNIKIDKIVGAYAIVNYNDGTKATEIMTLDQIKKSWEMGGSKGNSPAHKNFPDQMANKTVISRALKIINGSADDSALIRNYQDQSDVVKEQIAAKANKKELKFDDAQILPDDPAPANNVINISDPDPAQNNAAPAANLSEIGRTLNEEKEKPKGPLFAQGN